MMVATLAFEKNSVLLKDAAAMSIFRFAAVAPYPMLFPTARGTRVGKNFLAISLLVLLSLLTIFTQLISTILLSDTGQGYIPERFTPFVSGTSSEISPPGGKEIIRWIKNQRIFHASERLPPRL